jgi:1-acyl-sn-glycerol-3-phosphate acyltransferase
MSENSQFALLRQRRFGPFFLTQFAGAFNDNVFKNALLIMIAFSSLDTALMTNLAAGLFILPFFLLSATAGQIADRYEKSRLMRLIKLAEIVIMTLGATALMLEAEWLLLGVLFLMGTQSAFFGPVKYSILPQHLHETELVGGNGLVEMGTFVAILLGTISGGVLIALDQGPLYTGITVIILAVFGWLASRGIPEAPANDPDLRVDWNVVRQTWAMIDMARGTRAVFQSVLGISWFWMLGTVYLTQFPNYTRLTLGGDEHVVTLLLATFSVGVAVGSVLCERLSGHRVELGLVPFGSIGLSLFGFDLFCAAHLPWTGEMLRTPAEFLADPAGLRVIFDLAMLGLFGGFYIVPLYAIVQSRSEPTQRSRIIAANNILNALFMVGAALLAIALLKGAGLSIPMLFLVMAGLNVAGAVYIYTLVPEFLMRFLVWLLTSAVYRIRREGLSRIPDEGAALIVCNHVSYVDAMIIAGAVRRPVRFVMDHRIFKLPILNFVFRTAGAIPIAAKKDDPIAYERAFERIADYLDDGELVCIFPEGRLTQDGEIAEFRPGVARIIERNPVPVIPMALQGLWGSMFSRSDGRAITKWPAKLWARIGLAVGDLVSAADAEPELLQARVMALRGEVR